MRKLRIAAVQEKCGGVNETTIYRWIRNSQFPKPIKLSRRVALWNEIDVDEWIKIQEEKSIPQLCAVNAR